MICCSRVGVPVGVDIVGIHGDGGVDVALFWDVVFIVPMPALGRPVACLEADLTERQVIRPTRCIKSWWPPSIALLRWAVSSATHLAAPALTTATRIARATAAIATPTVRHVGIGATILQLQSGLETEQL
jgi:hypothetical protein